MIVWVVRGFEEIRQGFFQNAWESPGQLGLRRGPSAVAGVRGVVIFEFDPPGERSPNAPPALRSENAATPTPKTELGPKDFFKITQGQKL